MKLIELLVKELPRRGGWPDGVTHIGQEYDRELMFYGRGNISTGLILNELAIDHRKLGKSGEKITRAQYEAALAASKAVVGHNGWIQWAGGECPVDSDAIVEVKYRKPNQYQFNNDRAGDFNWAHDGFDGDIIAYRLQHPGFKSRANDERLEQDLNECIGQDVVTEWDGDGLPPAGCECEARYRNANAEWAFFRCVVVDCGVAFGWSGKEAVTLGIDSYEFRPLRTEAEMAREAACRAISHILDEDRDFQFDAKKIYDAIAAGKIPGVKLEGK